MSELESEVGTPVRRVRWYHLVVPILAVPGALFLLGVGVAALTHHAGNAEYSRELSDLLTAPETRYVFTQIVLAVFYIAFLAATRLMLGRVGRTRMVADYVPVRLSSVVLGLLLGVVLAAGSMALIAWLASTGVEFQPNKATEDVIPHSMPQLLMAAASIVIIGPYAEELYFRGALLSWLRDKIGLVLAILVSAAIFGLVHLQFLMAPGAQGWILTGVIAAIGVVNGLWAARTGSLWPAFATHAAFNGAMVAAGMIAPEAG